MRVAVCFRNPRAARVRVLKTHAPQQRAQAWRFQSKSA
jgi:hypothetical protein